MQQGSDRFVDNVKWRTRQCEQSRCTFRVGVSPAPLIFFPRELLFTSYFLQAVLALAWRHVCLQLFVVH